MLDAVVEPSELTDQPAVSNRSGSSVGARVSAILPLPPDPGDVLALLVKLSERVDEVILVGGASTADAVKLAHATKAHLHVVEQSDLGKEAAFASGFAAADGEIVVMLDVDSDVSGLDRFIGALEDGAAFGSRAEDQKTASPAR